jgi:methionyl-tRNA formyltransferase
VAHPAGRARRAAAGVDQLPSGHAAPPSRTDPAGLGPPRRRHRVRRDLDTGAILAQAPVPIQDDDFSIEAVGPRIGAVAIGLLPTVFARILAGDPGDPQPTEGITWAGHFGEDYASVDWTQPARRIHDQVRAWAFTFDLSPVIGPVAELDGKRVRLVRTSLVDPGGAARRVETGDGPLWILETAPLD